MRRSNLLRHLLRVPASLVFFATVGPQCVRAQAPPGPLPQSAPQDRSSSTAQNAAARADVPRTKILVGTWRLNLDESDDPGKKLRQSHGYDSNGQYGGRRGGGMSGGWPGGGGMGAGRGQSSGESDSDREKMHLFLEPAQQLRISQKEPEIDVADDSDRRFVFYTDNRKVEKSKDASHQEFAAKWDEYRLVADGKDPRGNKYERSYEVLDGNQQLRETLLLKVGRNSSEVSIRYVYDLVSPLVKAQPQAAH